jgi:hypothetical protein
MLAIRLSPELEARLTRLALETRRSKSHYVKEALYRYLDEREEELLDLARRETRAAMAPPHGTLGAGHRKIDRRSLAMHRAIAEKLRKDPRILGRAKENIQRWRRQGVDVHAFREWEAILAGGIEETIRVLCGTSEESERLRHSTPFTGILSPRERRTFFAKKPA